jgi:hypothetical protein
MNEEKKKRKKEEGNGVEFTSSFSSQFSTIISGNCDINSRLDSASLCVRIFYIL